MSIYDKVTGRFLCECGCGEEVNWPRDFRSGHNARIMSEETKGKISKSKLGICLGPPSESHSRALSEANYRTWSKLSLEDRRKRLQPAWDARNRKPNQGESLLDEWLQEEFPGDWKYVGNNEVRVGSRNPDFININGRKAVIELFGTYYHNPVYFPEKRTEEETMEDYRKYGFDCLVVWYGIPDDLILEWSTVVVWIRELGKK